MRIAREYHLRGEVWNSADGSVKAILQSDNSGNLERAIDKLKAGPGRVQHVEHNELAAAPDYDGFSVTSSRAD